MNNNSFDIFELELFQAVVKAGSLTAAAEKLGVPTSTISRRVKQLEERAQVTLFDRKARGLVLTEAGEYLFQRSDHLLAEFTTTLGDLHLLKSLPSGKVVVHCPTGGFSFILTGFIKYFKQQYPNIRLDIISDVNHKNFTSDLVDVYLLPGVIEDSNLEATKVYSNKLGYMANKSFVKEYGFPQMPSDLDELPSVMFSLIVKSPRVWGFSSKTPLVIGKPHLVSDDFLLCIQQVKEGLGFSLLPIEFIQSEQSNSDIIPLFGELHQAIVETHIVTPKRSYTPKKVTVFIECLKNYIALHKDQGKYFI